jgi:predicted dinucleotide-utilizing enzyme
LCSEEAAREILREVDNRVRDLNLTQLTQREAQRQREREEGLARINQFKQEDVEAGRAAIEAAEQVVPEILEQAPEVSLLSLSL